MLDVFNFANPQTCNYQEFHGSNVYYDWVKPKGVSMIRFLLIGAGGAGTAGSSAAGGAGGASGAVTTWIGPAMFVPDELQIFVAAGTASSGSLVNTTAVNWQGPTSSTPYSLLLATGNRGGAAPADSPNNYFGASGIFNSVAGQAGAAAGSSITASTTTFLSGGAGGANIITSAGGNVATKYGYPAVLGGAATGAVGGDGYFLTQPLLLNTGGAGGGGNGSGTGGIGGKGAIGCGGGGGGRGTTAGGSGGRGGDGAVFIWSW